MVRKIKVSSVDSEPEPTMETNEQASDEQEAVQTSEVHQQIEPITEEHVTPTEIPIEVDEVAKEPKPNKYLDMPTTSKILQQVSCQACGKKMSAKVLRYSHSKYCSAREREEQPEVIPIPKMEIKSGEKLKEQTHLPVKNLKLKHSRPSKPTILEEKGVKPTVAAIPPQTLEMDQSFTYTMKLKNDQRSAKYQTMLANAF